MIHSCKGLLTELLGFEHLTGMLEATGDKVQYNGDFQNHQKIEEMEKAVWAKHQMVLRPFSIGL